MRPDNNILIALFRVSSLATFVFFALAHHYLPKLKPTAMPFFSKSRSSRDAPSLNSSSSASLLLAQEKKCYSPVQKDYSAAFGTLASQYGHGSSMASSQPPAYHVSLPQSSQSHSRPAPVKNVKQIRAKDLGALQNKYGAIGYGGMSSIV